MEASTNIKVAVRCRPVNKLEKELGCKCIVKIDDTSIILTDPNEYNAVRDHQFTFDHCYFTQTTQEQIYADLGVPILEKALAGYNGTIFAYGQTGSGKTHSITGTPDAPGIIPRMNKDLFEHIAKKSTPTHPFLVLISYLELYNENIHDLMNPDGKPLKIREHPKFGVYVENLAELVVSNAGEIEQKMIEGNNVRHVAATKMNERSSRSHSVFTIKIEQKDTTNEEGTSLSAKINLVDLAGSERAGKTEAEGSTLKEASMINGSLSALGNVINALADPKKKKGHIPFRSSKLTRLLQESLGGNTVTSMIAAVSPADRNFDETLNTLQYANRAKNIQNVSKKNETNLARVIKELKAQIEELTLQLERGGGKQTTDIQRVLAELEFVKLQNWEEKRKLSQRYEANRWVSIAKNGMLQFKANLLRQQTFQSVEEIEFLKDEKTQLLAQLAELDGKIGSLDTEVRSLTESEKDVTLSHSLTKSKITDVLTRRIATKWRTAVLLKRSSSKNILDYKAGANSTSASFDAVVTFQEKLHQQHGVIVKLREDSSKAASLEEKINYQNQEMELLQEESAQLQEQNDTLEAQIAEKAKEMEALCEEVATMLNSENKKIDDLTEESKGILEELQATREAMTAMQEFLLQELARQEEVEDKIVSVSQENARLKEIRKMELESAKTRTGVLSRIGSKGLIRSNSGSSSLSSSIGSFSSVYAAHVAPPPSDEELITGIERSLSGSNLGSISSSVRDGVFLCKLINKAAPGTIDERVLNTEAKINTQEARENINLCLDSARALGCNLSTISIEAIMSGEEGSVTALIAEVVRVGQLSQVNVQKHTSLLNLRDKSEDIASFFKLSPEAILLRWFNYHLVAAKHPRTVTNFGSDIKDSENYAVLLNRLAPPDLVDMNVLRKEPDLLARAHSVLEAAAKIGCKKYVSPRDIIEAHEERNVLFVGYLFEKFPEVELTTPQAPTSPSFSAGSPLGSPTTPRGSLARGRSQKDTLMQLIEENQGEKREERAMRVWINSLGLPGYVRNLATELSDGILILQILDKVYNGMVNWKKVNKTPNSVFKKIENCNYCVELGKQLKFSLVGIAGKDIYDGNMKLSLALLSQVMQFYFLNKMKTLRFGGKEVKEEDLVKWLNDKVATSTFNSASKERQKITSFKDATMSTCHVFIDLLHALRPGCVSQALVQRGESRDQCLANAKYVVSVARKIGVSTFLVPEDLVELNSKMILAFVGSLMSLQDSTN